MRSRSHTKKNQITADIDSEGDIEANGSPLTHPPPPYYQVEVFRQKTLLTSGAAHLNMDRKVFDWVTTFIEKVRPCVLLPHGRSSETEMHILLPWSRKQPVNNGPVKMSSGSISKSMRMMFVKSGVLPPTVTGFTCNILRKATSTALHQIAPQCDDIISGAMSHRIDTAQDWYRRPDKSVNTVTAQHMMGQYWGEKGQQQQHDTETTKQQQQEQTSREVYPDPTIINLIQHQQQEQQQQHTSTNVTM